MTITDLNANLVFDEGDDLDKLIDPIVTKSVEPISNIITPTPTTLSPINHNNNPIKSVSDYESDSSNTSSITSKSSYNSSKPFKREVVWIKATFLTVIHLLALYGITLAHKAKLATFFFSFLIGILSGIGVQCGAHRLWSHKAYKATLGLR